MSSATDTWVEIQSLLAEYWASVDRVAGARRAAAAFYTEDGEMCLGSLEVRGRAAIVAFFRARDEREIANNRATRHLLNNLRVEEQEPGRVVAHALMQVYSGMGAWPLVSGPPSGLGDFEFHCRRSASTGWLIERVTGKTVFAGAGAPDFAKTSK